MKIKLGESIKNMRKLAGMSVEELAVKSGLSFSLISKIESTGGNPSLGTLVKIAKSLGIAPSRLLKITEEK